MLAVKEHMLKREEDLENIPFLFVPPSCVDPGGRIRKMQKRMGQRGLCAAMVRGALDCRAGFARDLGDMMLDYHENHDFFDKQIGIHHEHSMRILRAVLEAGAEMVRLSWYFTSLSAGWSPKIIKEEFVPLIKEQAVLIRRYGAISMMYDDGRVMGILEMLKDTGIDVLETCGPPPAGDFDSAAAVNSVGSVYALRGGIDQTELLLKKTPKEIEAAVRDCLAPVGRSGGFLLSTGDPPLKETPEENVAAFCRAGKEWGKKRR